MAIDSTRKLKMKFKTVSGEDLNIILNYAKDNLKDGDGAALVRAAMDEVLTDQPMKATIASKNGAEVIETTTTDVEMD